MTRIPKLFVPAITPFKADLSVDPERFIANCQALLADGADGLAPFGTTSAATNVNAHAPQIGRAIDLAFGPEH